MTAAPELRLALGMRGGVSLAVWMGGACSEIDQLRRALDTGGDPLYGDLLRANGYGSVAVDVVAGASAGGLNSVLMGVSVVHGVPFGSQIRNLWLQLGDLGKLVRQPDGRAPLSPLDGDAHFYAPLARKLRELVENAVPPDPTPRMDAILTCTRFTPAPRTRFQDLGPPIVEGRNQAWFRFQNRAPGSADAHRPEERTGFGSTGDAAPSLDRLAYAARTTSSFPGAFEPASIGYADTSTPPPAARPPVEPPVPATHYGSYSESRAPESTDPAGDRDYVIDGGVLDNIPVAWAVRTIAAAPANKVVDRWLLYLQPIPFAQPERASGSRPPMVETINRARELKGGTERLADDLDELERLNAETLRREGFQQVLEYALGQLQPGEDTDEFMAALYYRAHKAVGAYRKRVGALEAGRIRALWIDPLPVLGADPLSFADVTPDPLDARHEPLLPRLQEKRRELVLGDVPPAGDAPVDADQVAALLLTLRSPQALARSVSLLLDTARELGEPALAVKEALYGVRGRIELLIAHADRALAAAPRRLDDLEKADVVDLVRRSAWGDAEPPDEGWPDWAPLWDELVEQARALAALATDVDKRAFVGCLVRAARKETDAQVATAAVLAAVEVLTGPLRSDPLAETTHVRFHMLSARNRSALVTELAPEKYRRDLEGARKLAGNQLLNFGAFLSSRWRLNDWTWGRLDAARSLVEIATSPPSVRDPRQQRPDPLPRLREAFDLPAGYDLDQVREAIVRQLHDRILREELPVLDLLPDDGPPTADPQPRTLPAGADLRPGIARLIGVGAETPTRLLVRDVGRFPDLARLLGVGAYAAGSDVASRAGRRIGDGVRGVGRRLRGRPPS
jgi:predicted acylesterase/phospholipase RssA